MWRSAVARTARSPRKRSLLATLGLADDAAVRVAELPYGKQRLVEIAIALGLKPKVLLLDEPAAGVPSSESERILRRWRNCRRTIAILIIEHDMDLVFRFARRITVLVQGAVLVEGTPEEIARDKRVHQVYLGEAAWLTGPELSGVRAGYGETVVLEDVDARAAGARLARGARPQRRGQDHAARHHHGPHHFPRRADPVPGHRVQRNGGLRALRASGIGYVPQERMIFPSLTVHENLDVAAPARALDARRASTSCFRD